MSEVEVAIFTSDFRMLSVCLVMWVSAMSSVYFSWSRAIALVCPVDWKRVASLMAWLGARVRS
jgi:hypothetical protein